MANGIFRWHICYLPLLILIRVVSMSVCCNFEIICSLGYVLQYPFTLLELLFININSDSFPFWIVKSVHCCNVGDHSETKEENNHQQDRADDPHPNRYGEKWHTIPNIPAELGMAAVVRIKEWLNLKENVTDKRHIQQE